MFIRQTMIDIFFLIHLEKLSKIDKIIHQSVSKTLQCGEGQNVPTRVLLHGVLT